MGGDTEVFNQSSRLRMFLSLIILGLSISLPSLVVLRPSSI